MLIIRNATGVTIKRSIQTKDLVRIGVLQTTLWRDGIARRIKGIGKPHDEFSIGDCAELLAELESLSSV